MTGLTPVQAKTLAFIRAFIAEHGWSPSFSEICAGIGKKSKSDLHRVIQGLVGRGALTYTPGCWRSIVILDQSRPPEGIDFLPDHLATWIRVVAARAGVTPLQAVTECVRDGYRTITGRNPEQIAENVTRGTVDAPRSAA